MNALLTAAARYVVAAVALHAISVAVAAQVFAESIAWDNDIFQRTVLHLAFWDRLVLSIHSHGIRHVLGFFWPSAALVIAAFLLVYWLGRRHHRLWFLALPVMMVVRSVFDVQTRLVIWMAEQSSEGIYGNLFPSRESTNSLEAAQFPGSLTESLGNLLSELTNLRIEVANSVAAVVEVLVTVSSELSFVVLLAVPVIITVMERRTRGGTGPDMPAPAAA
jgi:hypothetical protein